MLNTDEFIKRLEKLMEFYDLSASVFADKIGVQRSGISHLLSGRNKPSLDFILKICEEFPAVNLYWLLNGSGNLVKQDLTPTLEHSDKTENFAAVANTLVKEKNTAKEVQKEIAEKPIFKIVFFYKDGSFSDFHPNL